MKSKRMLSLRQVRALSKKLKSSEYVIVREFLQIHTLQIIYDSPFANKIFFKGGTAIRLLHHGIRFSEDLDFTTLLTPHEFDLFKNEFWYRLKLTFPNITIKDLNGTTGYVLRITFKTSVVSSPIFIRMDFSTREKASLPIKALFTSENYPIISRNFIWTIDKTELLAEKIRALMIRHKPRDMYDIWFLLNINTPLNKELITEKLKLYHKKFSKQELSQALQCITFNKFKKDISPFLPQDQRYKLLQLYEYIKSFLQTQLLNKLESE